MSKGDARFDAFATDAKFRSVSKKTKRVAIDDRFKAIFSDPAFGADPGKRKRRVDERGRPGRAFDAKENLKRFYRLNDDDDDEQQETQNEEEEEQKLKTYQEQQPEKKTKGKAKKAEKEAEIKRRLNDLSVDYARGEAPLASSSDEDDSSSDEDNVDDDENGDEEGDDAFDKWGELDHDAIRPEHQEATRRLAVCNMDWDRVGAEDLFLAMSSFAPSNSVRAVRIYVSDFGKERMAQEERLGPKELRNEDNEAIDEKTFGDNDENMNDDDEEERRAVERVRRYQIGRLRYYYAIVEFDSASSADVVYKECDGMEYELSATRFDLRFVDDETTFEEQEAVQTCTKMPDVSKYRPKDFLTSALTMGKKVNLTWDETDPERQRAMKRAFERLDNDDSDEDDDEEINKYVAASSDEEENGEEELEEDSEEDDMDSAESSGDEDESENDEINDKEGQDEEEEEFSDEGDAIEKYRALIADIKASNEKKAAKEGEMVVTFGADNDEVNEDNNKDEGKKSKLTPWEAYLEKKKRRKREKIDAKRAEAKKAKGDKNEDNDGQISDDYFDDDDNEEISMTKKKKNKKKKAKESNEYDEEEQKRMAELDLMAMDSDEDDVEQGHFDYKDILQEERKRSKNRKKSKKDGNKDNLELQEDFEINVNDSRFTALYENPDFNIDPSHPSFKRSQANAAVLNEKQRRRFGSKKEDKDGMEKFAASSSKKMIGAKKNDDLTSLASKVAAKTKEKQGSRNQLGAKAKKVVKKRIKTALKRDI